MNKAEKPEFDLKKWFEQNYLDGDKIQKGQMIASDECFDAVREGYKTYVERFPIRELPESIDDKQLREVCKKMVEEFKSHHDDGKYKD